MVAARDATVSQYIDAKFDDTADVRPGSFQVAYYEANVPRVLDVDIPGVDGALLMKVITSPRKGVNVSIEVTPENMSHIFANIKAYGERGIEPDDHNDEPTDEMAEDTPVYDDEIGEEYEHVKLLTNNGKPTYRVEYRNSDGVWKTKSMKVMEGMTDAIKKKLSKFYSENHVPEGCELSSPTDNGGAIKRAREVDQMSAWWKRFKTPCASSSTREM